MKIPAGSILLLEHGEYSDFRCAGPFRVVKDLDQATVAAAFGEEWPAADAEREEWERPSTEEFIAWLATSGYIEDVPALSWYVGSYNFEPTIATEPYDAA